LGRKGGDIPCKLGITLDQVNGEDGVGGQEAEADEEDGDEQDDARQGADVLADVAEEEAAGNTSAHGEDETEEMGLGLPATTVALGVHVRNEIGDVTAEDHDEWTGYDDGQDGKAELLKVPAGGDEDGGTDLAGGALDGDEEGVDGDDPEDVGEDGGLEGLPDGAEGGAGLEAEGEDAELGGKGTGAVGDGVEAGARLAGAEEVDFLSGWGRSV
jgi:hypothetical protein